MTLPQMACIWLPWPGYLPPSSSFPSETSPEYLQQVKELEEVLQGRVEMAGQLTVMIFIACFTQINVSINSRAAAQMQGESAIVLGWLWQLLCPLFLPPFPPNCLLCRLKTFGTSLKRSDNQQITTLM